MSVKPINVTVSEKAFDLTQHLAQYVTALKLAVADGWQPGQDIPAIIQSTITHGYAVVQDLPQLGNEANEDKVAFAKALAVGGVDIGVAALS